MSKAIRRTAVGLAAAGLFAGWALPAAAAEGSSPSDQHIRLDVNQEDRDVGLKRMEILDKSLSPEILARKQALVRSVEEDYNRKISELLQRLTTAIARNTVITHLDVNFFDPGFESQVRASQTVSVSIILDQTGFQRWAGGKGSEPAALDQMKKLIGSSFKIPPENVTVIVGPN